MRKSRKETKGRIHDPILTHPVCGHWGGGPNGGGWGGGFSFGWMDVASGKVTQGKKGLWAIQMPWEGL